MGFVEPKSNSNLPLVPSMPRTFTSNPSFPEGKNWVFFLAGSSGECKRKAKRFLYIQRNSNLLCETTSFVSNFPLTLVIVQNQMWFIGRMVITRVQEES